MKKVLLRAPLLTNSGYGVHSRQVFEWLSSKKDIDLTVECLMWGQTSWLLDDKREKGLIGKIMNRSKKTDQAFDVSFQLQLPDEWDPSLAKYNVGMSAFVETDQCSKKWVDCCNNMDLVIVPSSFTKKTVKRSGVVTTKIDVIPEYFNQNIHTLKEKNNILNNVKSKFNFLMISQLTDLNPDSDRKNIISTLNVFCEAFKDNKDVGLIIKTSAGKYTKEDKKKTHYIMRDLIKKVRPGPYPKIHVLHGDMSAEEIAQLYNDEKVKVFLTGTRGEGYGIPLVDAAASGTPVVATNWSGHLDFLGDNFIKVDYDLVELPESRIDNRIFFKNFRWADPKLDDLKQKIIDSYLKYDLYLKKFSDLKKETLKNFGKENIFKMYDEVWSNYLND